MPSKAELFAFRRSNYEITTLAAADLAALWRSLDLANPEAARDALLAGVLGITDTYGQIAAAVAADWYDDLRLRRNVPGAFSADLAQTVDAGRVDGTVRRVAGYLWTDTPEATLAALDGRVQKYVLQPGRDTIVQATAADPADPRWARVPTSATPCDFCRMLAGRGAVYLSETTADGTDYHDHCGCTAVPEWDEE